MFSVAAPPCRRFFLIANSAEVGARPGLAVYRAFDVVLYMVALASVNEKPHLL
jgi:hypothetical protein